MLESPAHTDLAHLLTKHYFNDAIAAVVRTLFQFDQAPLGMIKMMNTNLRIEDLKKALVILIKYQLVDYTSTIKSCEYNVPLQRFFSFFRLPKFIQALQEREGEIPSTVLKVLAEKGTIGMRSLSEIVTSTSNLKIEEIKGIIDGLIARSYLVEMKENVYIKIERFDRDYRDDLIAETVCKFYNNELRVKSICRTILKLSVDTTGDDAPITGPVDLTSLHNAVKSDGFPSKSSLETYLSALITEANYKFFLPCGNHPQRGPLFALNVGVVIDHLLKEHICAVINARHGPLCCRLFRILMQKGPLLLKQIEEIIMLPARHVGQYAHILNKENLIRIRQVPRTADNAPGKSLFIFSVEMDPIVYKVGELCCRSMYNLLMRYEFELQRNSTLLAKSRELQVILKTSKPTEAWAEYFTSHEMAQLNETNRNLDKLLLARNQADETLFICHVWLTMRKNVETNEKL